MSEKSAKGPFDLVQGRQEHPGNTCSKPPENRQILKLENVGYSTIQLEIGKDYGTVTAHTSEAAMKMGYCGKVGAPSVHSRESLVMCFIHALLPEFEDEIALMIRTAVENTDEGL